MAYSAYRCAAEISTDGTTWTAIGDVLVGMDGTELALMTAENYVGGTRETAIITRGKREPVEITVRVFHRDGAFDIAQVVMTAFLGTSPRLGLRWSPQGLGLGNRVYATSGTGTTTDLAWIKSVVLPELDPGSAEATVFAFKLHTPHVRTGTATTALTLAF